MSDSQLKDRVEQVPANPYTQSIKPYALYVLAVLTCVNFLDNVDRQVVSIVAEAMKADLKLSDAQLGFLLGTAFVVFYGLFGIAVGRISDAVNRTRLLAGGMALWSASTMASGAVSGFGALAVTRLGVGLGEATRVPCTLSLMSDYFPQRNRAAAMGVMLFGTYIGIGVSLYVGALILQHWPAVCLSLPFANACGIASWQAAFLVVGAPGLFVALMVLGLKEPPREKPLVDRPLHRLVFAELSTTVPPFTLYELYRAGGWPALRRNLAVASGLILAVIGIGRATGDWAQWIATALGVYSVTSWSHSLSLRDKPLFKLTYGDPTFALHLAGCGLLACFNGAVKLWAAPYAIRELGVTPTRAGVFLGLGFALASGISVVAGGWLTDVWKRRDPRAPVWIEIIGIAGAIPPLLVMMFTRDFMVYAVAFFVFAAVNQAWSAGSSMVVLDLALSRMRGAAVASFSLVLILVSSAIGPFWVGKVSTVTGSLKIGMLSLVLLAPITILLLWLAGRRLRFETTEARIARARAFGEP